MRYTANYNLKKPEGTDIVNIDDLNENADIIDQKLKELEDDVNNAPPNSVNDLAIGTRTPNQTQVPTSPGTGTLTQLVSWLANRIKAITGKTNWWDAPPTTLQAAKNHIDASAPHSGHETPSGAQSKVNTHANSKQTHGISSGYYIAKTSRSDQLPAWGDIQGKPDLALASELDAHLVKVATSTQLGHVKAGQNITIDPDGTINAKGGDVNSVNGKTGDVILTASDVGAVPTSRRVNNKALTSDITLSASDVGAVPTSRKVNSKALTSDITIDVSDIPRLVSSSLYLGENAVALDYGVALGMTAVATGYNSVALGRGASAEGGSSVALGASASAEGTSSVALGASASAAEYAVVLGMNASAKKHSSVVLGRNASAAETYSVVLGRDASAGGNSVALGMGASAAADASVALGQGASAEGRFSVALGSNASVSNDYEGVLGGTGVGQTSKWIVPGTFTVNGTKNFEIPHPKPEKSATHVIRHSSVESPTPGDTLYRWKIQATKDNDVVTIDLPDYFIWLNKDVQIFVTPQGHFGNGYGILNRETEQLEIHCQLAGEYNVLVIGTRNDDHPSVQEWHIKGVEREIGESWTGETYAFSVDEIIEIEEIKEVSA